MAQNIYDNQEFFDGYSQLSRQTHGLSGAPEWAAMREMLPDIKGKYLVDLGCGFGWFSRWAREEGARSVLGLDISEKMIARAIQNTDDSGIEYRVADLESVELSQGSFDLAYSSLALHYVDDFSRLARQVYSALKPASYFVFSIEHPIYMSATHPHWGSDEDGRKTWPVNRYALEGERRTRWFTDGVLKYHRTIGTTLNTLIAAGFSICRVEEFAPTAKQVNDNPALEEELERPMMLLVSAKR